MAVVDHSIAAKDKAGSDKTRTVTLEELGEHCTSDNLWVAIENKVYDLTVWQRKHPGGQLPLLAVAGGDASDVFIAMHPPHVRAQLSKFLVGDLDTSSPPSLPSLDTATRPSPCVTTQEKAMISDYREMRRQIQEKGLMRPDPMFYVKKGTLLAVVLAGIVAGVVCTSSTVVHLLCAAVLGLWWNQMNFIGHDAGHNSITGVRKIDSNIGYLVGNALTGISIGWWKSTHNVHHIVCNSINYDPDLQHMPLFAVSEKLFESQFSLYHFRQMTFDALAQLLISYQHITFYPIMAVARINLYIQSLLLFFSSGALPNRPLEAVTMLTFWAWYSTLLLQLPSFWEMVAFFFISHAFTGILHVQICLSHFSSPTHEGRNTAALWAGTQLSGSMDVDCSPLMDWFHGGLQFQIEHHLFPRLPRRNLRAIVPAVKAFCLKHNIPYIHHSFWGANGQLLFVLRRNAINAQKFVSKTSSSKSPDTNLTDSFFQSLLWDALNARG